MFVRYHDLLIGLPAGNFAPPIPGSAALVGIVGVLAAAVTFAREHIHWRNIYANKFGFLLND